MFVLDAERLSWTDRQETQGITRTNSSGMNRTSFAMVWAYGDGTSNKKYHIMVTSLNVY